MVVLFASRRDLRVS
ncbi:unnamed protein product [Victoria cruziana]